MLKLRSILLVHIVASLTASTAVAQTRISVSSNLACAACLIDLRLERTLGAPTDPVSPIRFETNVVRDSYGRFYLAPTNHYALVAVYDSLGNFLRTIGRPGQRPGEFTFVSRVEVTPGDTLL